MVHSDTMSTEPSDTMRDVDHTPPTGEPVSTVWERGPDVETDDEE
jgi:hypothetical protein